MTARNCVELPFKANKIDSDGKRATAKQNKRRDRQTDQTLVTSSEQAERKFFNYHTRSMIAEGVGQMLSE
jgi:hypothetical protein